MATEMKRMVISIPDELQRRLDFIKRHWFYGDSWSEMTRVLLEEGAESFIERMRETEVKQA